MSLKDSSDEYVVREFPFKTLKDFLPGQLENKVCIEINLLYIMYTNCYILGIISR